MSSTLNFAPGLLVGAGIAILVLLVVLGALKWRENRERGLLVTVLLLAVVLAFLVASFANGVYQNYVASHTWDFSYYLEIQGNSTGTDAVVVPSVADESLLASLSLVSGKANWTFVDTLHGGGLYVQFTGAATLSAYVTGYPPPDPLPDASLTMTSGNGPPPEV